jgi:hypothetical protein
MKNYARSAWKWATEKLGSIITFIEPISRSLKVAIEQGDIEKIRSHNAELREATMKQFEFCDFVDEAIADDNLDLYEGAMALDKLSVMVDEYEDVIVGEDEDD